MSSTVTEKLKSVEDKIKAELKKAEQEKSSTFIGSKAKELETMTTKSTERKVLESFGASNVKSLLTKNVAGPEYGHVDNATKASVIQLKNDVDTARSIAQMYYGEKMDRESKDATVDFAQTKFAKERDIVARLKAFGSTEVGAGDEWVPTVVSNSYLEEFHLEQKLPKLFTTIPMPSNPFHMPVQTDSKKGKLIAEGVENTSRQFGTDKMVFDAKKCTEFYEMPEELTEDSAPAILQVGRKEVVDSVTRALESAILNGDITPTHMDSDVTGDDFDKAWKGLRKAALDAGSTVDFGGAGVTKPKLNEMRKLMGKYGVNPARLAWIVGPAVYSQMQALDIVESVEKFGPNATVLSGSLGIYNGISVCVSEYARENLNASGVYDGVTSDRAAAYLVNIDRFNMGMRRPVRIRVHQDPRAEWDRWQLVSYTRQAFTGRKQAGETYASGTASAERSVVLGIDLLA